MKQTAYLAIDLGAGSGRVILGSFGGKDPLLEIIHRFPNGFRKKDGRDRWDIHALFREILSGLAKAAEFAGKHDLEIRSLGCDTWGVDYGLFDGDGKLIEEPVAYRDTRTDGIMEKVFEKLPAEEIYSATGIQFMQFNTLFQLYAHVRSGEWPGQTRRLLLMPDIIHYFLTGRMAAEYTIASTTQLLNARTRTWDTGLFKKLGLPCDIMPELLSPGTRLGPLLPAIREKTGLPAVPVVLPAAHDTASAVAGAPLKPGWAYISSGTWSLVGVESAMPRTDAPTRSMNFTNEGGAGNTIRLLKNVMGLWILESCRKEWAKTGGAMPYEALMAELDKRPLTEAAFNPDDPRFLNPASMVNTVREALMRSGRPFIDDEAGLSQAVLKSLALRCSEIIGEIETLENRRIPGVRIVGGGCQNRILNRLIADAAQKPVEAGPVEATALGNLLIQAVADRAFPDLAAARAFSDKALPAVRFEPE